MLSEGEFCKASKKSAEILEDLLELVLIEFVKLDTSAEYQAVGVHNKKR